MTVQVPTTASAPEATAFSFGDPTPVLDRRDFLSLLECVDMGKWYEPPVSVNGLTKSFNASPHHSSAIYVKRNILAQTFVPHKKLSFATFQRFALEYITFGNSYLERVESVGGRLVELRCSLAKYTRRGKKDGQYFFIPKHGKEHEFGRGKILHLMQPDLNQELYGVPEYISAIQSALLSEASTLFRRKYYLNGSHAGYILYMSDPAQSQDDIDAIREALRNAKGPGNFRNLFMYSPNGKKDGVQVIPISSVAAKDDFTSIKDASRDDILAAHRVPPALMALVPKNAGGLGSYLHAAQVFAENELKPLQANFNQINEWAGEEIVTWRDYGLAHVPDK